MEKEYSIEVEMFATVSVDLSTVSDDELFRESLAEIIEASLLKTMREFNVEHIKVWVN